MDHGGTVWAGVGEADSGIVVILPVAADLACVVRAIRVVRSSRLRVVALVVLACCPALLACSGDEQQASQPQPAAETAEPQPTRPAPTVEAVEQQQAQPQTPTRAPGDPLQLLIAEAAALERNGYWEQALSVREQAIASGGSLDADALASLKLDQVRLLLRLNRPADAQAALSEMSGLASDQSRRHALLRAQAALMLSQTDTALEAMQDYVNTDSPAWALISLEIARTLQRAGRGAEAIDWAERALGGALPFQDQLRAIHLAATELDIAGETDRALARYDELLRLSPWRADQAAALSRTGALQRDAGEIEAAQTAWLRLVGDYREFRRKLGGAGLPARYRRRGRPTDNRPDPLRGGALGRGAPRDAQSAGRLRRPRRAGCGRVLHRRDPPGDRRPGQRRAGLCRRDWPRFATRSALAAESSMRLAEFAVADGDPLAAEQHWRRVLTEHPDHPRAPEAARRWASLSVARSEWSEAAQRFQDAADRGADHWSDDVRQELLYWAALMNREAGDLESAADLAANVVEIAPLGYYGLRAAALLERDPPAALDISVEEWLMRLTGESNPTRTNIEGLNEWRAARDLRLGGFDDAADRTLSALIDTLSDNPWALVEAAQSLAALGEHTASARAAAQVLILFGLDWTEAPPDLLRLAYPQPWREVMERHAADEDVDPSLLWSLIRRESFYDPDAEGSAGEVGLTQVIPLTGGDIAAGLGIEYEHADLARPQLAIRFGAWYLARQLEGFSNDPVMALAAYNAGPGNAARWENAALVAGPDGFLAAMDFQSTRRYVQYVIETRAVYRALAALEQASAQ